MKEPLWSRSFVLAITVNFLLVCVFYILITSIALYAISSFDSGELLSGVVVGSFVLGAVFGRLFAGRHVDRLGRKRTLMVCLILLAALGSVQVLVADLVVLIVIRSLHGVAFGAAATALAAGALSLVPPTRRAEGSGYYSLGMTLGSAVAPFVGSVLISLSGYGLLFFAATGFAVVALAVSCWLRLPEQAELAPAPGLRERPDPAFLFPRRSIVARFIDLPSVPLSAIVLITGIPFASVLAFLTPYAVNEGEGEDSMGLYFAVYSATVFIVRMIAGRVQDRIGPDPVIFTLIACLAIGMLLLAASPGGVAAILSAVMLGVGYGGLVPAILAIVLQVSGTERITLATSTFYLTAEVGVGIGPIAAGLLLYTLDYHVLFALLAGVAALAAPLYWVVRFKKAQ